MANMAKVLITEELLHGTEILYAVENWCNVKALNFNNLMCAGVCANRDFAEEDLILKDQMLVGAQHSLNKVLSFDRK